jgi:transposase-like protein
MEQFAKPGEFCPNEACSDYGKLQSGQQQNLEKYGKTRKGVQRYRCQTCGKTFTETTGTIFFRKRTPEHEILETPGAAGRRQPDQQSDPCQGAQRRHILVWLREAAQHAEQLEGVLMKNFKIKRGQLDALWAYVRNKGQKKLP